MSRSDAKDKNFEKKGKSMELPHHSDGDGQGEDQEAEEQGGPCHCADQTCNQESFQPSRF